MSRCYQYLSSVAQEIPRIISLIDRNPHSKTRGSFARTNWCWKFDDFPFPRLQEGIFALSILHNLEFDKNNMYKSDDVKIWISWGYESWINNQHKNGCFDEAYPNEQSFAATAFTLFYLASAYREIKDYLTEELRLKILKSFRGAAEWLVLNDETHGVLSNHLAVAVAALAIASNILDEPDYLIRANFFLDRIFKHQSDEGWLSEYGGADIGYGTHGFFYLAIYWRETNCQKTLNSLNNYANFLSYFMHPDGTIGGEYSSRNTEFYFPAGFEILAKVCKASRTIAHSMRDSVFNQKSAGLSSMDIFNYFPMLNNYLFSFIYSDNALGSKMDEQLPCKRGHFIKYFSRAGILVINQNSYYGIIGVSKGGTIAVYSKENLSESKRFSGYLLRSGKKFYSTQQFNICKKIKWINDNCIELNIEWSLAGSKFFTPYLFILFRVFNVTLGNNKYISKILKNALVKVLVLNKKNAPIKNKKIITFDQYGVQFKDFIDTKIKVDELIWSSQFTSIHMGSSLYADNKAFNGSTFMRNIDVNNQSIFNIDTAMSAKEIQIKVGEK